MGMFDFLKKPVPTGDEICWEPIEIQTLEVVPEFPTKFIYPVISNEIRKGMWVRTDANRIGILGNFLADGVAEVHLTDADGITVDVQEYPINTLVRAKASELPAKRVAGLSAEQITALGYGA